MTPLLNPQPLPPMESGEPVLDFAIRREVPDFSLDVRLHLAHPGITVLFGPSGSGKTSLLHILAGLIRPQSGYIRLAGKPIYDARDGIFMPPHRRQIGYVFQEPRLFPHLSVKDNILYAWRRRGRQARSAIAFEDMVTLLGLQNLLTRRPAFLSGGEKQRTAIARALMGNPQLLLMDEPLANLDERLKNELLLYIEALHQKTQIPILYVTHDIEEVFRLADQAVLIERGQLKAAGSLGEIAGGWELASLLPGFEPVSMLPAQRIAGPDTTGLSHFAIPGGELLLPAEAENATRGRLMIRASDISLSLQPVSGISILNQIPVRIAAIDIAPSPPGRDLNAGKSHEAVGPFLYLRLALSAGDGGPDTTSSLLARISRKSVESLALQEGQPVYALIKSAALTRPLFESPIS